jgi:hypothetical protein
MLEYTLEENLLTEEAGDCRAQVVNVKLYMTGEIVDRIMRIGAGLTRSDIASVLEAEKQVMAQIVAEGRGGKLKQIAVVVTGTVITAMVDIKSGTVNETG